MAKKHKPPQEWRYNGEYIFTHFVRRTGERIRIIASVEDLPLLSKYRWGIDGKGRAYTNWRSGQYEAMHRIIMPPPEGMVIDHINSDYLDNRRENLRICTHAENLKNQRPSRSAAVKYKGVSKDLDGRKKPYRAKIAADGKHKTIGSFETPEQAAKAYDEEATRLHGEYAKTNKQMGLL